MTSKRTAAVIGAGPGGLAAAMLLAGGGYDVSVFEKQPYIGGRTSRLEFDGFKFDRGATFLMMPELLEELFDAVGRSLHDYVDLKELDPLYQLRFGELKLEATRNRDLMKERIEHLFPGNGEGYTRFMQEEKVKFDRISPLLKRPISKLTDYIRTDVIKAIPKLNAMDTVYGRLSKYYSDERLKFAFTFQAKYLGMSPWECPGTFSILSYLEHEYGLFHPVGGVNAVCEAMVKVIQELGGSVHLSCGVDQVLTRHGKTTGVLLESGEKVESDHVVINADFATAVNHLFEPGQLKKYTPERVAAKKYSCSTYMLYLGVEGSVNLPHHTVIFSDDYKKNVDEITKQGVLSKDPSIYVHNPSALDTSMAPEGKSGLYVLMPVPNLQGETDWPAQQQQIREDVIRRLEQEPEMKNLSSRIVSEQMITPQDWQDRFHVYRGATFNLSHSLDQMMHLRPHNRFEELDHCWLVGGGTHPGSGLPTIWESARISVKLLMDQDKKEGVHVSPRYAAVQEVPLWK
ncbi:phytoene desaturase family protein [Paenibacillus lemnae]|uniref:Phytoene desaturase n=1 Tax=Paenibacillus lemnae TaxID=1330551 RepID=A0A848MA23_PAELE|nr:phytoene desaturase family protein [Paenibacillus lemnae]NMO97051.1 phytoene desaturase [Paenibacillus lemnae]